MATSQKTRDTPRRIRCTTHWRAGRRAEADSAWSARSARRRRRRVRAARLPAGHRTSSSSWRASPPPPLSTSLSSENERRRLRSASASSMCSTMKSQSWQIKSGQIGCKQSPARVERTHFSQMCSSRTLSVVYGVTENSTPLKCCCCCFAAVATDWIFEALGCTGGSCYFRVARAND